jgi:plastocyanin
MRISPFLLAVVLVGGGIFAPSVVVAARRAPTGTIGMTHEGFAVSTVTIPVGSRLTFFNDSSFVHVVGPGDDGRLGSEAGTPQMTDRGAFLSEKNDSYTTGPWLVPGTYHLTCSLHPEMNLTVIVTS